MMKIAIFIVTVFVVVQSQRPPYAGRPNRYPQVLPQYLDPTTESVTTDIPSVDNRIDGSKLPVDNSIVDNSFAPGRPSRDPSVLPPQAGGDWDLVDRIGTWPVDRQPFWYLNWKHIQAQIGGKQPPASLPRRS